MKNAGESIIIIGTKKFSPLMVQLLQQGFFVNIPGPVSFTTMLSTYGISDEYIRANIKTLFYNSSPVDDINGLVISTESTVAISGAMPGLVGAALRAGGPLSSFRSGITYGKKKVVETQSSGFVKVKLFNTIMKDTGRLFLSKGIFVRRGELARYLEENEGNLNRFFVEALVDGRPIATFLKVISYLHNDEDDLALLILRNIESLDRGEG